MKILITIVLILISSTSSACFKQNSFDKVEVGMTIDQVGNTMLCKPAVAMNLVSSYVITMNVLAAHGATDEFQGEEYVLVKYIRGEYSQTRDIEATIIFEHGKVIAKYFNVEE